MYVVHPGPQRGSKKAVLTAEVNGHGALSWPDREREGKSVGPPMGSMHGTKARSGPKVELGRIRKVRKRYTARKVGVRTGEGLTNGRVLCLYRAIWGLKVGCETEMVGPVAIVK